MIPLYSNNSSPICSLFCCLCRHPNSKISSYHSTHSEITLLTNNESKSSIQSSCPTHNCIKTGHQSGLHSILSFTIQCFTRSSSLITRNRSSVTSGLKMSNWSFFILSLHSCLMEWFYLSPNSCRSIAPLLLQLLLALASLTLLPSFTQNSICATLLTCR